MPLRRVPKLTADELEAWAFDYPGSTIEPDPETRTVHLYDINGRELAYSNLAETWRAVPNWPLYEVSDMGNVRSRASGAWRLRATVPDRFYERVSMSRSADGTPDRTYTVHQLVAEAFLGPRPEGMEVRHLNGNGHDNRLSNLAYGTPSENGYDRVRHGTHPMASKTYCVNGHEFTDDNLKPRSDGYRECLTCARENTARRITERSERRRADREARPPRTHCLRGHEFTPENTYVRSSGGRICRECARLTHQRRRAVAS